MKQRSLGKVKLVVREVFTFREPKTRMGRGDISGTPGSDLNQSGLQSSGKLRHP